MQCSISHRKFTQVFHIFHKNVLQSESKVFILFLFIQTEIIFGIQFFSIEKINLTKIALQSLDVDFFSNYANSKKSHSAEEN